RLLERAFCFIGEICGKSTYVDDESAGDHIRSSSTYVDLPHFASLEKYAASPHMLMMNGCDQQPIQTDLSEALKTAEALYPDVTFKHSNFNDYIASLSETLPADLKTVEGELRSQRTDGWG